MPGWNHRDVDAQSNPQPIGQLIVIHCVSVQHAIVSENILGNQYTETLVLHCNWWTKGYCKQWGNEVMRKSHCIQIGFSVRRWQKPGRTQQSKSPHISTMAHDMAIWQMSISCIAWSPFQYFKASANPSIAPLSSQSAPGIHSAHTKLFQW